MRWRLRQNPRNRVGASNERNWGSAFRGRRGGSDFAARAATGCLLALCTVLRRGSRCRSGRWRWLGIWLGRGLGQGIASDRFALAKFFFGGFACGGSPLGTSGRRWGRSQRLGLLDSDFGPCRQSCLRGRISARRPGGCGAGSGFAQQSQKIVSSIATAVSGHGGKLLAVPIHREPRPDGEGSLDSNAGAGERCIFQSRGSAIGGTSLVLPADLSHGPHNGSRFEITSVHAMCIGEGIKGV